MLLSSVRRPLPQMDMRLFPAQNIGSKNRLRFVFYSTIPGARYARSPLHSVVVSQVVASDTSSLGCGLAVELHIAAMQCLQARPVVFSMLLKSAACCNAVQYVATQCSTLQQRATCCHTHWRTNAQAAAYTQGATFKAFPINKFTWTEQLRRWLARAYDRHRCFSRAFLFVFVVFS